MGPGAGDAAGETGACGAGVVAVGLTKGVAAVTALKLSAEILTGVGLAIVEIMGSSVTGRLAKTEGANSPGVGVEGVVSGKDTDEVDVTETISESSLKDSSSSSSSAVVTSVSYPLGF